MEAAVVVRHPFPVVQVDRPPRFEPYVVRDRDQVRLVLHGAERVGVKVDQQLLSGEALSRRHRYFVAAVPPNLHAVVALAVPAGSHVEPRGSLQGGHMAHQQAVVRVRGLHHVIHRVGLGRDQVDHVPKLVVIAIPGLRPQRDPFVVRAAQPRVGRHKVVHVVDIDRLAGLIRAAQADENIVPCLADRDLVLEIELSGFGPAQRRRDELSEVARVVLVDRAGDFPTRWVVPRQKVDVVQPHRRPFDFRRPAARACVDGNQQVLGVDLDRCCRARRQELRKRYECTQPHNADMSLRTHGCFLA